MTTAEDGKVISLVSQPYSYQRRAAEPDWRRFPAGPG